MRRRESESEWERERERERHTEGPTFGGGMLKGQSRPSPNAKNFATCHSVPLEA